MKIIFHGSPDLICGHGCQIWRKTFYLPPEKGGCPALDLMGEGIFGASHAYYGSSGDGSVVVRV